MRIWFMFDNHTFAKVTDLQPDALMTRAKELFAEDGCGSMFVHDESGTAIAALTLHGGRQSGGKWGVTDGELRSWVDSVEAHLDQHYPHWR